MRVCPIRDGIVSTMFLYQNVGESNCLVRSDDIWGQYSGARQFGEKKRNFNGESLWARGYAVSTVGFELEEVRKYIRHQEKLDNKDDEKTFKTFDLGSL